MKVLKRQFSISKRILATERIGIGIVARIDPLYYLCSQSSNPACNCSDAEAKQLKIAKDDDDDDVVYPRTKSTSQDQFIIPKNTLRYIKSCPY